MQLGIIGLALATFVVTALLASDGALARGERAAFEWVNGWPDAFGWLEVPMQLGTLALLPAVAVLAAFVWRRPAPVLALVVAEVLARLAAGAAKDVVERPRPAALLDGVELRDPAEGYGFPSGHAAVAAAGAAVAVAALPARWRWLPVLGAALVAIARVFVGVHLPLDVVGGTALGVAIGASVVAVPGVRSRE